jgi:exosortase D (VPLPA-CTERM-specific)
MLAPSEAAARDGAVRAGVAISVSVVIALVAFSAPLSEVVARWVRQDEYSHGFLIPVLSAWLLWSRRDVLLASIGRPSSAGLALIALSILMLTVGELSALFILSQVGFVVALLGAVLGVGGYSLLRVTIAPALLLLFAIPLPYFIESVLTWRLQLVSSELGVQFIRLFQIPVYLEGNIIDLGHYQLQVVEACSGLRYLYPLLSLSFLAAYFFHAPLWQRAIVFLSAAPIAILMNSVRIGIVGVLVNRWGTQAADGLLHFFEGWVVFIACVGLLLAEIYVLARLGSQRSFFEAFGLPQVVPASLFRAFAPVSWKRTAASPVLLCVGGLAVLFVSGRQEILPERLRFVTFPSTLGEWVGHPSLLEPQIEHALGLEDYILSDYGRPNGGSVNLYVAYYASQRKGLSPHSPIVCMPGGGWQITRFERTAFQAGQLDRSFPYNRAVITRGSTSQVVYYWFTQRGRNIANEYVSKVYLFTDAILENRTDGALVRVTTPLYPNESERDADARLQAFIREMEPRLRAYLPARAGAEKGSV